MASRADQEIIKLLNQAEQDGSCAVPDSKRLKDAMRRRALQGRLTCPYPGLYIRPDYWKRLERKPLARHLHLLRGLQRRFPKLIFYGPSAAVVHGLQVSKDDIKQVHIVRVRGGYHGDRLVCCHAIPASLGSQEDWLREVGGLRVSSRDRAVIDSLRMTGFKKGLAIADSSLRMWDLGRDWLEGLLEHDAGHRLHGLEQARLTISYADGRSENGGESFARGAFIERGYQIPDLQVPFDDALSGSQSRVDFLWRLPDHDGKEGLVAGEFDGRGKYEETEMTHGKAPFEVLWDERQRESRLTKHARVVRFRWCDIMNPETLDAKLDYYDIPRPREPESFDIL